MFFVTNCTHENGKKRVSGKLESSRYLFFIFTNPSLSLSPFRFNPPLEFCSCALFRRGHYIVLRTGVTSRALCSQTCRKIVFSVKCIRLIALTNSIMYNNAYWVMAYWRDGFTRNETNAKRFVFWFWIFRRSARHAKCSFGSFNQYNTFFSIRGV